MADITFVAPENLTELSQLTDTSVVLVDASGNALAKMSTDTFKEIVKEVDRKESLWDNPNVILQSWLNNIVDICILPRYFEEARSFRVFISSSRENIAIFAYNDRPSSLLDKIWYARVSLSSSINNKIQPLKVTESSIESVSVNEIVGFILIRDCNALEVDGNGRLLNNLSVVKDYNPDKYVNISELNTVVNTLSSSVELLNGSVESLMSNTNSIQWQNPQVIDSESMSLISGRHGEATFCENALGLTFDTVKVPFQSSDASKELILTIAQTNESITKNGIRNALNTPSNILTTKTITLGTAIGYYDFTFDTPITVTKKNVVISVYSSEGNYVRVCKWNDVTDKKYTTFWHNGTDWFDYAGSAESSGYGAFPYLIFLNKTKASIDNLQEEIDELQEEVGSSAVDIVLPDKIRAVVGDKLQVFYRSILKVWNPYEKNILLTCIKGNQYPRFFEFTPVAGDIGSVNFNVKVRKNDFVTILANKTCSLQIVNVVNSPASNKNIVCIGDSLTSSGKWVIEASRRLTGSGGTPEGKSLTNLIFCGAMGSDNAKYYGVGGWSWVDYATAGVTAYRFYVSGVTSVSLNSIYTNNGTSFRVLEVNLTEGTGNILCQKYSGSNAPQESGTLTKTSGTGDATIVFSSSEQAPGNPFWDAVNNKISFADYANNYCNGQIDAMYVFLGANGLTPNKTDFSGTMANVKNFADELHTEFPNAKLKIMGCAGCSRNGGMGFTYGATGTSYADEYGIFLAMLNLNKAYQEFANQNVYSSFVEYVDVISQLDVEYNFPRAEFPVNSRSTIKEYRDTNGVHPSNDGYNQIADVVYRNIIAEFCQ